MAVLYTHGFNDDGAAWGVGGVKGSLFQSLSSIRDAYQNSTDNNTQLLATERIESYAVQWTVTSPDEFSDPYSTADEGFAFLADEAQMKRETDWITDSMALHNRARPNFQEVLKAGSMNVLIPQYEPFDDAVTAGLIPVFGNEAAARDAGRRTFYLGLTANRNTYNDSGRVDDHSTDLLDLLREERMPGGKLADYRQVNIMTHSKGSLVTRVTLSKAEAAGREDAEYVANVVYNAPPFAGSSLAELLKFMYDPIVFTRLELANPWLAQTWDEAIDLIDLPNPRLGDGVRQFFRLLCAPFGCDWDAIEPQIPLLENNIELLNVFTLEAFTLQAMANSPPLTLAAGAGNLFAAGMTAARPVVTAAIGIPSFPTAREDLPPEESVTRLQTFMTASNAAQFVNAGTSSPFGVTHMLWPNASYASIAADPTQIYDVGSLQGQRNDTYVALGAAELLTATDTFGPRMTLAEVVDIDHGGITERHDLMATNWFSFFLAPPTTLHMNGAIDVVSEDDRIYSVSPATTFSFISSNFTAAGTVNISAQHHQYRFVPLHLDDPVPTPWEQLNLGASRTFDSAVIAHGLAGAAFELQWRAVNLRDAREMIRAATIVVDATPPTVTDVLLQGNTTEILQRNPSRLRGSAAIRSTFFDQVVSRTADLAAWRAVPEPDWTISNPAAKYLVAVFDKNGSVDYAWNDPTLSSPTTLTDVNALFLPLTPLADGLNTLTYQPFTVSGGGEERGPVQTIRIFVDNKPPEHSLAGLIPDPLGLRVGPNTPLLYRSQDLETGADGTLSVFGFSNAMFASGATFTLGETDVIDQIKSLDPMSVGGFITLAAAATDRVNNASTTNFTAYFDFTAPTLTNANVLGGIPTTHGAQVFTNTIQIEVDVRDANASVLVPPCAAFHNTETDQTTCSAPFAFKQSVGAYARYTGSVFLVKGVTAMQIMCQDVFGNVSAIPLVLEYLDPPPGTSDDLTLVTPRIDNENSQFYDPDGNATNFTAGSVLSVNLSYDGSRIVFSSSGNGFVYGDSNMREDVFVSEMGRISRVSVGPDGEQALGGESDNPSISGNGRYVFFESDATNLVPGTSNVNLYVKDLETDEIAVISRHFDGSPINRLFGVFDSAPTYYGRYVFFSGRNASYVDGLNENNTGLDIYMVDLDPDANGYYFDDNYVTHAISTVTPAETGNGESRDPCVSDDGQYLLFETQATDIDADLALNGVTADALSVKFAGSALDGTLDVSNRTTFVVNRSTSFAQATSGTTANGIMRACIAPDGDTILFSTRSNISSTGDTNNEATQEDVYGSIGESFGVGAPNRLSSWQSRGVGGAQSVIPGGQQVGRLTVASDLRPAMFFNNKIAWVSAHSNLVAGDGNLVADLFVGTAGGLGVMPLDPPAPNWVSSNITSSATVQDGGLTPDGRYAWWVSTQTYLAPFTPDRSHIYLRRIDPPLTNELTIVISGNGSVTRSPTGSTVSADTFSYVDLHLAGDEVVLEAVPDIANRFVAWHSVDHVMDNVASVRLLSDRTVTAEFAVATAPGVPSPSQIFTDEDTPSAPMTPTVLDGDPGDTYTLTVLSTPTGGVLTANGSQLTYTPHPNSSGMETVLFAATDSYGLSGTGFVQVTVNPVNDPPVVGADLTLALQAGTLGPFVPVIEDPDPGDTHTFSILLSPSHGTASNDVSGLYYTSNPGFTGPDSFTYQVTDAAGASDTGSILIDVLAPPAISNATTMLSPGDFSLDLGTLPDGLGYTVECTDQMAMPDWQPVAPTNQWPSTNMSFDAALSTQRYYRLRFEILDP